MSRSFVVNGETMVSVKGGLHLSGTPVARLAQLGLSIDQIVVSPNFKHQDILVDDFGPQIPADIMWHIADVNIRMNLVNFDRSVLMTCVRESMAGGMPDLNFNDGLLAPTGSLMGNGVDLLSSGNHFISLNLLSPVLGIPWRFRASYLTSQPLEIPLGVKYSMVMLNWRAIPYQPMFPALDSVLCRLGPGRTLANGVPLEILSSGALLWDNTLDDEGQAVQVILDN